MAAVKEKGEKKCADSKWSLPFPVHPPRCPPSWMCLLLSDYEHLSKLEQSDSSGGRVPTIRSSYPPGSSVTTAHPSVYSLL